MSTGSPRRSRRPKPGEQLGWPEPFTIAYVGTVGLAQGIGTLLDAASCVDVPVAIRIVGEGVEKPELVARARAMGLQTSPSTTPWARPMSRRIIAAADAGLVILRLGRCSRNPFRPSCSKRWPRLGRSSSERTGWPHGSCGTRTLATSLGPRTRPTWLVQSRHVRATHAGTAGAAARTAMVSDYARNDILDRLGEILREAARP